MHPNAALIRDRDHLAHRYDPATDRVHVIPATRAMRQAAVFLTDEYLQGAVERPIAIGRDAALAAAGAPKRQHYLFHSAFCCSTLIANAFERPGVAMTLKEPVILNDLSGWRRRGGSARDVGARLADMLTLLAASTPDGEASLVKPSNVTIALSPAMLALRPDAHAVLLYAPLDTFVASIASKGMWGRLWVRDLWRKLDADGLCELGFEPGAAMGWTDLQVAAMGWLAQHRLFADMTQRFGARVATLDSAALLADPARSVAAIARHYAFALGDDDAGRIATGPAFARNAKTGERFGPRDRAAIHDAAREANRDEVEKVVAWTHAVADANQVPLILPRPLPD